MNDTKMESNGNIHREEQPDILKGIGIVMMVAGHAGLLTSMGMNRYVGAFYMPMFFFVSGYFLNTEKYTVRTYFRRKIKQLLLPYVIWSVFYLAFWVLAWKMGVQLEGTLWEMCVGVFWDNNKHYPIAGAMWFVSCLFLVSIVTFAIIYFFQKPWQGIFVFLIVIIGLYFKPYILLSGDSAMVAIGFFYLGILFRKQKDMMRLKGMNIVYLAFLAIINVVYIICYRFNGSVNLRTCVYGRSPILFCVTALFGIFIWWEISGILGRLRGKSTVLCHLLDIFSYFGRNSMPYLCLNQLLIAIFERIPFGGGILHQAVIVLLTLIIIAVVAEMCTKLKPYWNIYGFLFGR